MNFDDTAQEAAFRAEARQWIDVNAPKELEVELSQASLGRIKLRNHDIVEVAKEEIRRRLGLSALAKGIWRSRSDPCRARHLAAGGGRLF